jgi:hypothetical protein
MNRIIEAGLALFIVAVVVVSVIFLVTLRP